MSAWQTAPASGVELMLSQDDGHSGKALRVDFDFHGGGGWAAFRKPVQLDLPENYEISFWLKGDAPKNTLEFKLVDPSGENVWWVNRPEFEFAGDWRRITFRKRHVTFAWGPAGGGDIRKIGALELAITAGTGGKGTVWIDDLTITPREPVLPYDATPIVSDREHARTIDFTRVREFGGIVVEWRESERPRDYEIQLSNDGEAWQTVRRVHRSMRQSDYIQLPETESRYLRLALKSGADAEDIADVRIMPLAWGATRNALFDTIAAHAPRGSYPKYFTGTQSYWTVFGENGAVREALMNEEGAVEVDKRSFSIEPFLFANGQLITWNDVEREQSLYDGFMPIPTVTWQAKDLSLDVTSWVDGETLWLRYRVTTSGQLENPMLFLAVRPFQVNPETQFLNNPGGAAAITSITGAKNGTVTINGDWRIEPQIEPAAFGAATFDEGDVVDFLRRGQLPRATSVTDSTAAASAAFAYRLNPSGQGFQSVYVAVTRAGNAGVARNPQASFTAKVEDWRAELSSFTANVRDSRLETTVRSNLAYILVNRDRAAIQPGSRSYERSWIRDGSLTSEALLRLGHAREVREFIEWYAPFQYRDGKVPCCVDQRGADPVPENDSHGQLIYLITEYFRYTRDTAFTRQMLPHVERAVAYMDSLRQSRRTKEYQGTAFYGLLPQSISHEGYSAKPMHSYWDDFFALRGYKDAAWLAGVLGDSAQAAQWRRARAQFQADLMLSLRRAMRQHKIGFLPGAAELGDFDATSTTVAVNPAAAQRELPLGALKSTFDRYWTNFVARRDTAKWDAYTPYEWRVAGTYVRMGERRRAHSLYEWFMKHRRPTGWNHWAEVVYRDPAAPHFIGDMPHTWVGSDFIRSVLDMFAYDDHDALIIAAGVLPEWVRSANGVSVSGLHTPYGEIAYRITARGRQVTFTFARQPSDPPNGFIVKSPLEGAIRSARVDGKRVRVVGNEIRLRSLPRQQLVLSY